MGIACLYRLDGQSEAQLQQLKLGRETGRYIEIISGAKPDDYFIISDLSNLATTSAQLMVKS